MRPVIVNRFPISEVNVWSLILLTKRFERDVKEHKQYMYWQQVD